MTSDLHTVGSTNRHTVGFSFNTKRQRQKKKNPQMFLPGSRKSCPADSGSGRRRLFPGRRSFLGEAARGCSSLGRGSCWTPSLHLETFFTIRAYVCCTSEGADSSAVEPCLNVCREGVRARLTERSEVLGNRPAGSMGGPVLTGGLRAQCKFLLNSCWSSVWISSNTLWCMTSV